MSSDRPEITVTPEPFLPFFSKNILKGVLEFNLDRSFLHLHFRKGFLQVVQILLPTVLYTSREFSDIRFCKEGVESISQLNWLFAFVCVLNL